MDKVTRVPLRKPLLAGVLAALSAASLGLLIAGCGGSNDDSPDGLTKVKVCYIGLTCEPSIYVAYEKGFFKEEGLAVDLYKADWDSMRDKLAMGHYDATHHLIMYLMNPVAQGLDVRLTAGIHTGCLRLQAGAKTDIRNVEDLKGKTIGISHLGAPPFLFASRVLAARGLNPSEDVKWVAMPNEAMGLALDQGRVDAVANAEPIGTILLNAGQARKLVDQAEDEPYRSEYCCAVAVNGTWAKKNPEAAAKVTRALLKGARWVHENKMAAAKLAVEKKYLAAKEELNAQAIAKLSYMPGVSKCRKDLDQVADEMAKSGFLAKHVKPRELASKAWLDLPGVTDQWVAALKVERIPGGGDPPPLDAVAFRNLFSRNNCCEGGQCLGCCGELDRGLLSLTTDAWARVIPVRLNLQQLQEGETKLVNAGH
jgi:NitT/TauT family transport system substrate-binding protein